jgi:predicted small lipoprotein YifL
MKTVLITLAALAVLGSIAFAWWGCGGNDDDEN